MIIRFAVVAAKHSIKTLSQGLMTVIIRFAVEAAKHSIKTLSQGLMTVIIRFAVVAESLRSSYLTFLHEQKCCL